ncbi:MAG TPA: cytochrome c [Steroidobacteraceae bacterium]|nr:cytochrome c [Steroidobacteraceae bacterium]
MRQLLLIALAAMPAVTAQAADLDGKQLFHQKCEMCHGPVGMGTGLLARRMKVAQLEKRDDLSAAYVERAARVGVLNMPPITRGDVSDAQLKSIALYLSKGKP